MSAHMGSVMRDNAENMLQLQREMMLKQREAQLAVEMARARELFNWTLTFTCTVGTLGLLGAVKTKTPTPLIPLVPLSFVTAYQYDFAHGSKMERIRTEAGKILANERLRFTPPEGQLLVDTKAYEDIFSTSTTSSN